MSRNGFDVQRNFNYFLWKQALLYMISKEYYYSW